ncbi:PAAR domain-containing protein [Acetobacter sacchari]|uniref:PAAR domain-containing protein n=1 Tax=Acetobacter sacchari TaxID=2661687 RepID=A0ABS3LSM0_9PROT|nr:PAAR domain-containing protein [Acetobacter sacchari]MBO1358898.1 PAAR domain-containing protein [Acetobacter sacchari]
MPDARPAARLTDMHVCPIHVGGPILQGSPNVLIGGLPAARMGDMAQCITPSDPAAIGAATVLINGRPAVRMGDATGHGGLISAGCPTVLIGGPCLSAVCASLASELAQFEKFRIQAQAAAAAYDPPESRTPPEGYRNASDADLAKLHLKSSMLENPVDPDTHKKTNFRAAVFINEKTGDPLIAYKGTTFTSREDWGVDGKQALGRDTFYYRQAQRIGMNAADTTAGQNVTFTGHSLGGGMAAAAARATGRPAVTYNAAGLHARTVPHPQGDNIDDVYVRGEILHASQAVVPKIPVAAGDRHWPLDPVSIMPWRKGSGLLKVTTLSGGLLRAGLLHMMGNVQPAIDQKIADILAEKARNGCA